ncbi:MAG: FkbM family methyltransferase [Steroidobacteraceae bacterium]|nr:FkbM family methyltransferase [Steroidobacteraceae bacterium]
MRLLAFLRRLDSRRRDNKRRPEVTAFDECVAKLGPGDIAIDCGANVGKFTVPMAQTGATVYAFEPNPDAFAELVKATAGYPNVKALQAAATTEPGAVKLYLHRYSDDDPLHFSSGSTLVTGKRNVREDHYTLVEGIPFAEFVRGLGARVRLLKMDIEGAEVAILNRLLDEGLHRQIDQVFVEVHDRQNRSLAEPTRLLRERLAGLDAGHIRLDWR